MSLRALESALMEARTRTGTRLDQLGSDLRSAIEGAANTLAAYIGELEDRMEKRMDDGGAKPAT